MHRPSAAYAPKAPAQRVLYQVVRDHFETFRAEAARVDDRNGLPRFIEEEFRGFLRPFDFAQGGLSNVEGRCGFLAGGFARFHCARRADGTTRLVFDPIELLERLAALTPRSRINLLLYYGVLGARSGWRARLAGSDPEGPVATSTGPPPEPRAAAPDRAI